MLIATLASGLTVPNKLTHRRRRRDSTRRCEQNSQLAHDDCRRIRSTYLETDQTDSIAVSLHEFWSILITFQQWRHYIIISRFNSTWNCKLGHDCWRVRSHHWRDATQLDSWVASAVAYGALSGLCYRPRSTDSSTALGDRPNTFSGQGLTVTRHAEDQIDVESTTGVLCRAWLMVNVSGMHFTTT